jgi:hypothetical protein
VITTRTALPGVAAGAVALTLALTACSSGGSEEVQSVETASSEPTTTVTTAPPPVSPLTGLVTADPAAEAHPAVTVKMDNSPEARPQSGINQADVVYEMKVEGITRFALVFHSVTPDGVGPVRSARSSDIDLVADLSTPLFVWSGGNAGVTDEVLTAAREGVLTNASVDVAEAGYHRSRDRSAPHNLYVDLTSVLAERTPAGQGAPAPIFGYRTSASPAAGANASEAAGVRIDFGLKTVVEYAWDPEAQGWRRFQVDQRHGRADSATVDADGVQVAPANVIVQFTHYGVSPSDSRSPKAFSVGEGEALVFTGGQVIPGRWVRPSRDVPAQYVDASGQPILLSPGRTWVELAENGSPVEILDHPTADELLADKR